MVENLVGAEILLEDNNWLARRRYQPEGGREVATLPEVSVFYRILVRKSKIAQEK